MVKQGKEGREWASEVIVSFMINNGGAPTSLSGLGGPLYAVDCKSSVNSRTMHLTTFTLDTLNTYNFDISMIRLTHITKITAFLRSTLNLTATGSNKRQQKNKFHRIMPP